MLKVAVVIPAFNEQDSIAKVVQAVNSVDEKTMFKLIPVVINDCSTDKTSEIIASLNCIAIQLPVNLGIGGAVQAGFRYAYENNFDYAVQVDGDGQHPVEDIVRLIEHSLSTTSDIVIGSRFIEKKGFQSSLMRRAGINFFRNLIQFLVKIKIYDSTSGFRLINKNVLKHVADDYPDEYPEPESILIYALKGFKISEISVEMKERQGGVSSIGMFSSVYYMFKVSLAIIYTFVRLKFSNSNTL